VLFLDELSELSRSALKALREPLEEHSVIIVRGGRCSTHPARFLLLAATNPCRCGHAGESDRCRCSDSDLARYARKGSGPLLDRLDLRVELPPAPIQRLRERGGINSARARELVHEARERQVACSLRGGARNAVHSERALRSVARPDARGQELLERALAGGMLSARGALRLLRAASTIADVSACERVGADNIASALALRCAHGAPAALAI